MCLVHNVVSKQSSAMANLGLIGLLKAGKLHTAYEVAEKMSTLAGYD